MSVTSKQVQSLVGKHVFIMTREGKVVEGTLYKFSNNKLYLRSNAKPVGTSAFTTPFITTLVLFDLLAISLTPFFFFPFFI